MADQGSSSDESGDEKHDGGSNRSKSGSPHGSGSPFSGSGSLHSGRSQSGSPASHRSKSGSPNRSRSPHDRGNVSPEQKANGSPNRSRSGSPNRSKSGSPNRSRSGSPNRSRSGSPNRSKSGSPNRSRSGSPKRSGSGSPNRSGSGSPNRSGSGSPNRSRSGSPNRSRSGSPNRSRSGSPNRSRSGSPNRSRSGSPDNGSQKGSPRKINSPHSSHHSAEYGSKQRSGSESPASHRSGSADSIQSDKGRSQGHKSRSNSSHSDRSASPGNKSPASRDSPGGGESRSRRRRSSEKSKSASPDVKNRDGTKTGDVSRSDFEDRESPSRAKTDSILRDLGSSSESQPGSPKEMDDVRMEDNEKETQAVLSNDDRDDDNDDDGERKPNSTKATDNLFGDAHDISSDSDGEGIRQVPVTNELGGDEGAAEYDEDQLQEPPETRIDVEIPRISTKLGKQLFFVKLPNFLSVDTRPYDPQTYEDEIDEDEVLDEEGRARLKLKVENTIRWRVKRDDEGNELLDENGVTLKESNARVVRWSDGSMSLHLGEEVFDIHTMPLLGDYNHLFVRQGTGLQGQAVFKAKLTFRPSSTESMTHRKMTMSLADRSLKTQKVKVLPIAGHNPDAHRTEMIKKEEEKLRASMRRESHQRRLRERQQARSMNTGYLEGSYDDDDDEADISISAIKNRYKKGARQDIYSDSDDGSDSENEQTRKLERAKKIASDDEGSDSGSDAGPTKKRARIVESEDEDGDD